jgi:hypothetical protein
MNLSIHDVKSITLGRVDVAGAASTSSRELVIVDAKGNRYELTLWAAEDGALAIRHSEKFVNVGLGD